MSDTIELLSPEKIKTQFWAQYKTLAASMNQTLGMLRALGEKGVPNDVPLGPIFLDPPSGQATASDLLERHRAKTPNYKQKTLSDLIREAGQHLIIGVTRSGVEEYIKNVEPDREVNAASLSALMSQIAKDENWQMRSAGKGGQQTIYDLV